MLGLLFILAGCTRQEKVGYVYREPQGGLGVHHPVEPGEKLIWKTNDTSVPQFWVHFRDPAFCKDESGNTNDFMGTRDAPAHCTVIKPEEGPYAYWIQEKDPKKYDAVPPPVLLFVQNCKGCT